MLIFKSSIKISPFLLLVKQNMEKQNNDFNAEMLLSLLNSVANLKSKKQATDSFYLIFCTFDHVTCIGLAVAGAINYSE